MNRDEVQAVVDVTLAVMARLAERTRTKADDLMVAILQSNRDRLTEVVLSLAQEPAQPLTPERVSAALAAVGIRA